MAYSAFYARFPEIAKKETRAVTVLDPLSSHLPPAQYFFIEMFCDEPGCDCRRAFFSVASSLGNDIKAVIAWGWEDRAFYRKWLGMNDADMIKDLMGPVLNLASPQSDLAPALLKLFQNVLLPSAGPLTIAGKTKGFRELEPACNRQACNRQLTTGPKKGIELSMDSSWVSTSNRWQIGRL